MNSLMSRLLNYKILLLMYFAGFMFITLLLDLFWWRTGAIPTLMCWQMFLAAALLSGTHFFFFECNVPAGHGLKKRILLHVFINYALLLALFLLFGWISRPAPGVLLLFTVCYTVAYVGLCFGFSIYYSAERTRLNGRLELFKQSNQK